MALCLGFSDSTREAVGNLTQHAPAPLVCTTVSWSLGRGSLCRLQRSLVSRTLSMRFPMSCSERTALQINTRRRRLPCGYVMVGGRSKIPNELGISGGGTGNRGAGQWVVVMGVVAGVVMGRPSFFFESCECSVVAGVRGGRAACGGGTWRSDSHAIGINWESTCCRPGWSSSWRVLWCRSWRGRAPSCLLVSRVGAPPRPCGK